MKKRLLFLFLLFSFILVSGCSLIIFEEEAPKVIEESPEEEELPGIERVGPEGCIGEECTVYCRENPEECDKWCKENPDKCPQEHTRIPFGDNIPGFMEMFIKGGPGGCRGPECEEVCSKNPELCAKWCQENPEICAVMMGGGLTQGIIEPPNTVITFAKTVNLNVGQTAEEEILRAKAMGANMVTLWPARPTKEDDLSFLPSLGNIPGMINFAHKNGLQVELRGTDVFPRVNSYEKYKASAILHVAEWAKFAEKYNVYRMVPFGEVDNDFVNHPDKITEFAQEMLPEMRKYYSGQIGIGVIAPWRDSGFTFEGYDYLTFSAYPQTQIGMDKWLTPNPDANRQNVDENNLVALTNWVREVADRSGVSTIHIGEIGVQNVEEKDPTGVFQTVEVSKEKESEFYEKMFSQISDKVNGVSVFYNSKVVYMSVYGDPAEEVVKEWYNKLGNS